MFSCFQPIVWWQQQAPYLYSNKDYKKQRIALDDVINQVVAGEKAIVGTMLESNLLEGRQDIIQGKKPVAGISITDACIGWDETEELIRKAYDKLASVKR